MPDDRPRLWFVAMTAPATDPRRLTIDTIRVLAMDSVQKANAGHPGTAMALAPVAYLLYGELHAAQPGQPGLARP